MTFRKMNRGIRGFTLIETILTIAMTVLIMLSITNLYLNFTKLYAYQQTQVATGSAASSAVQAIHAAVLPANQVVTSHSFSGTVQTTGSSALVLEVPSMNASGDIVLNTHDYIAFYLIGTDLYRRVDAGAGSVRISGTKKVAARVTSIGFTYDHADVTQATRVSVTVTVSENTKSGMVQTSLEGTSYLRNK